MSSAAVASDPFSESVDDIIDILNITGKNPIALQNQNLLNLCSNNLNKLKSE